MNEGSSERSYSWGVIRSFINQGLLIFSSYLLPVHGITSRHWANSHLGAITFFITSQNLVCGKTEPNFTTQVSDPAAGKYIADILMMTMKSPLDANRKYGWHCIRGQLRKVFDQRSVGWPPSTCAVLGFINSALHRASQVHLLKSRTAGPLCSWATFPESISMLFW